MEPTYTFDQAVVDLNTLRSFAKDKELRVTNQGKKKGYLYLSSGKKAIGKASAYELCEFLSKIQGLVEKEVQTPSQDTKFRLKVFSDQIQLVLKNGDLTSKYIKEGEQLRTLNSLIKEKLGEEPVILTKEQWKKMEEICKNFRKEPVGFGAYFLNKMTLTYNIFRNTIDKIGMALFGLKGGHHWWDVVFEKGNAKIILGAMPLQGGARNDADEIEKLIGADGGVLSVVESFENKSSGWFFFPVKPKVWLEKGVHHLQLPTADFHAISEELIDRGVEYIRSKISQGKSIYVHCKAGKSRSALMVMCYLMRYEKMTADEAFKQVLGNRHQATLNHEQLEALKHYYDKHC